MPGTVSENCLVALRFSKNLNALLFRCSMNVSSRTRLRVGFRCFEGHFRTRWCLRHVFCGVMHHCVVRRSGSVPTEIAEPTREAQSSRHVFIETLQSKDFSEILLICVNLGVTASRSCQISWSKNLYFFKHKKYYGHNLIIGVRSLSYITINKIHSGKEISSG